MRPKSPRAAALLTAGLLVGFSLACSGIVPQTDDQQTSTTDGTSTDGSTTDDAPVPTTLPAPWAAMMLPVGDGTIVEASAEAALVSYPTDSLLTLTNTWTGALVNAGYAQAQDVSKPGLTALIFRKGTSQVGLATGQEQGLNFAYVEDLGKVKRSMIRGQRQAGLQNHRRLNGLRRVNGGR